MGKNFQTNNATITLTERPVFASRESENNVLGLMLRDRDCIPPIVGIIGVEDFNYEENKRIFSSVYSLYEKGTHIDPISVWDNLSKKGEDAESTGGGITHLHNLHDLAANPDKAEEYAKNIQGWSAIRQVKLACDRATDAIKTGDVTSPTTIIDNLTKDLHNTNSRLTTGGFHSASDMYSEVYSTLENAYQNGDVQLGVPTGIAHLDNMIGGYQKGDYIVLGARTSMGKTAFAIQCAAHAAIAERLPTVIFSLEMSRQQLMYRMISGESGVSAHAMRRGEISNWEWDNVQTALETLKNSPIIIDDTPQTTVLEIKAKLKKLMHHTGDIGLVVIDYINILKSASKFDNSYAAVGEISGDLKALARELNVPLLVLAQLNRGTEGRQDKMPSIADIADSDKIARDADLVMLLYRNAYYNKKSNYAVQPQGAGAAGQLALAQSGGYAQGEEDNSAVLLVDKYRNGPTGSIELQFDKKTTKFSSGSNYRR